MKKIITMIVTIIPILFLLLILLYSAEPEITFSPFSIKFAAGKKALGFLFIIIGFFFIRAHYYMKGVESAIEMIKTQTTEELKRQIDEYHQQHDSISEDIIKESKNNEN